MGKNQRGPSASTLLTWPTATWQTRMRLPVPEHRPARGETKCSHDCLLRLERILGGGILREILNASLYKMLKSIPIRKWFGCVRLTCQWGCIPYSENKHPAPPSGWCTFIKKKIFFNQEHVSNLVSRNQTLETTYLFPYEMVWNTALSPIPWETFSFSSTQMC